MFDDKLQITTNFNVDSSGKPEAKSCKFIVMNGDTIISEIEGNMADFHVDGTPKSTKHPLPGYSDPDAFLEVALKADVVND